MPRAKPTLGFASRTDAVIGLRRQGLTTRAIAEKIGIRESTVSALEHSARKGRPGRPSEEHGRTVLFPIDVLNSLSPHAARRNIHVNSLVRRLIECIVDDNIVDAVMGDADFLNEG